MSTDLFRSLNIEENRNARGNPALSALLYAYCPAAAGWWLAGVSPEVPFDPVWESLTDYASLDKPTLKLMLEQRGFAEMLVQAKTYIEEIAAFRRAHAASRAPELNELFAGGKVAFGDRFGNNGAIAQMGGDWSNFFAYVRTWVYLVGDWARGARIPLGEADTNAILEQVELAVALPGIKTIYLPAWLWTVKQGYSTRFVVGLLTPGGRHDQVRLALAGRAGGYRCAGERETAAWRNLPEVYAFHVPQGMSEPADLRLPDEALADIIQALGRLADKGSWAPARALADPDSCGSCAFRKQCFTTDGSLSPFVVAKLAGTGFLSPTSRRGVASTSAGERPVEGLPHGDAPLYTGSDIDQLDTSASIQRDRGPT